MPVYSSVTLKIRGGGGQKFGFFLVLVVRNFRENSQKEKRERGEKRRKGRKRKRKRKRRDYMRLLYYYKVVIFEGTLVISREFPLQRCRWKGLYYG